MKMLTITILALLTALSAAEAQLPLLGDLFEDGKGDDVEKSARRALEAVRKLLHRVEDERPGSRKALAEIREAHAKLERAIELLEIGVVPRAQILCEAWFIEVDEKRDTWLTPIWKELGSSSARWAEIDLHRLENLKAVGDVITTPKILALQGQESVAEVGSTNEMPVLRRTGPATYKLENESFWDGIRLAFTSVTTDRGEIVTEATTKVSRIVGRMPVKEGARVIGAPRMQVAATELRIVTRPGVAALLRLPGENGPSSTGIILRLQPLRVTKPEPSDR